MQHLKKEQYKSPMVALLAEKNQFYLKKNHKIGFEYRNKVLLKPE